MAIRITLYNGRQALRAGRALDDPIPGTPDTVADMLPPDYSGPLPTALPEFFGDFNLVNGMAWPKLYVAQGEYLFHYANASDSRFYDLQLSDPHVKVTLVGADGGLLKDAKIISDGIDANNDGLPDAGEDIILAPGDRIDLVVDFSNAQGDVILQNTGPAYEPFKGLGAASTVVTNAIPGVDPIGEVMKFTWIQASRHSIPTCSTTCRPHAQRCAQSEFPPAQRGGRHEFPQGRTL